MKRQGFRILLVMLMSITSMVAFAYDAKVNGIYYNFSGTEATVTYLYSNSSSNSTAYSDDVVIPETVTYNGTTYTVTSIGNYAFSGCSGLTSVTIPNSVTSIGNYAFEYCSGLTEVNYNATNCTSSFPVFYGCSSLATLNIGDNVQTIPSDAFSGCSGLTSITIPNSVTSIGNFAFVGCSGLTSVTIPNSVTSIGRSAFGGLSGLTSVTIGNSVTSIGSSAFYNCSGLTSVTIPNSVTSIGNSAFEDCSGLTSITIPNSVTSIGEGAFAYCSGLTSITVETGNAVYDSRNNCDAIIKTSSNELVIGCKNTVIPNSVTSIGAHAFYGCSSLMSITIPNSVTSIGDCAFSDCSGLTSINIPNTVTSIGDYAFRDCSGLTSVTIPNSVTSIGERAFDGCSGLTSITIPNSVTSIGDYVFYGCSGLTSITIPNSVTSIGSDAFSGCSGLTSITVETGNAVYDSRNNCNAIINTASNELVAGCKNTVIPNSVTSIGSYAFEGCSSLTSINIPNSVTNIGKYAFRGCSGLTSVTIPNSVTSIGGSAFYGCSSLMSITIPNSVTSIGNFAFVGCSGLTSIIVETGNAVYDSRNNCNAIIRTSDNTLLSGCKNTVIPSGVTSIGKWAFNGCSGLTSVRIPSSVTSIGIAAFSGCSGLTSVTIPSSVTSIDNYVFRSCSSLTSLIVGWETPIGIDVEIFGHSNYNNATLYVPKGTKAAYEAAAVWQDFGSIEEYEKPQENVELTDASAIDNVIYMDPIEVTKGKEVTVSLKMKNTAGIRGFQFDMQLPLGVTVKKDGNDRFVSSLNDKRLPSGSAHTLTVSEQQDGAVRFLCGSQYDETFTGSDGEILTVRLCIDEHMLDGQYPVVLKNVKLTETNINNYYETATVQTAMTVIAYTPGDISGDGVIDVSDYIGVANYIIGDTPAGFVAAAADVNKDQKVDVSDYIGIANMILYDNIYGQAVNAARSAERRHANTDVSTLDNVIYISPLEAASNGETQVSIRMKNTVGIRGFQFDLYLPDGMTAVKDGNNRFVSSLSSGRKPGGDQHTLTLSEQPDGAIRFLCGSQYDETFTGNDGEIATLTINIDASVAVGDYPVYLRNMKLTETDISKFYTTEEVETTVTVTGATDGRVVLDETSTTAPDVANGVDVRVKRTINAGEWSTICLPFAMSQAQCQAAFGSDVQIGDFTGCTVVDDNVSVNFSNVTAMEANHPYIIKVSSTVSEFTVDGVDIAADNAEVKVNKSGRKYNRFIGNYENGTELEDGFLFLNANKFYFSNGSTKIKAFRGYFNLETADAYYEESRRIVLNFGDATGIETIVKDEADKVFNLSGQRVKTPAKGVFVKNGKKIIVK